MIYLRILSFVLTMAGAALVFMGLVKFHKTALMSRAQSYLINNIKHQRLLEVFMAFFILSFLIGALYNVFNETDPGSLFVSVVFFVGGSFVYAMNAVQYNTVLDLFENKVKILKAFVNAIEMKDRYTKGHSQHVQDIVGVFLHYLPDEYLKKVNQPMLMDAALLHDVGKISVSDEVLNKRGPLDEEEWEVMKTHPVTGEKLLTDSYNSEIGQWVLYHHERIDGNGYMHLDGELIPTESRIISIADTFSALITDRVYRKGMSLDMAFVVLESGAGRQLDADLVSCFTSIPKRELLECTGEDILPERLKWQYEDDD